MFSMTTDCNILFSVLAVQLGFATPQQVMAAAAAWAADQSKGIAERLEAEGIIDATKCAMLRNMAEEAVKAHGGDVQQTIASFGGDNAVYQSFGGSFQPAEDGSLQPVSEITDTDEDTLTVTPETPGRYSTPGSVGDGNLTDTPTSEIGRGGIGRVLVAYDQHLGREVAIKELLNDDGASISQTLATPGTPVSKTSAMVARFLREARVTGQLEHPNIVPVYEVGRRKDGKLYYTMKIVRGKTLAQALKECGTLPERLKLLNHFVDLCQAVAYAHSRGVVHRDIKPENVMLGEFGETVVLDWGMAKIRGKKDIRSRELEREIRLYKDVAAGKTIDGHAIGTPAYMSPEQAEGRIEAIDERSDVWGLGAVLYEILTGQPPCTGVNAFEIIGKVIKERVKPVKETCEEAPIELAAVAEKALVRERDKRYQSAKELAEEVESYLTGGRVEAYEYSSWELLRRFYKQNKAICLFSLLFFISAIIFILNIANLYFKERQSNQIAEANKQEALFRLAKVYQDAGERALEDRELFNAKILIAASLVSHPFYPGFNDTATLKKEHFQRFSSLEYQSGLYETEVYNPLIFKGVFTDPKRAPVSIALSPDGRHLAWPSAWITILDDNSMAYNGIDNDIQIIDTQTRKVIKNLEGHSESVIRVAFSPDGKQLASIGWDGYLKLWNTEDYKEFASIKLSPLVWKIEYSQDSRHLMAFEFSNNYVFHVDTAEGILLKRVGFESDMNAFAIHPKKKQYAISSPGSIWIKDFQDRTLSKISNDAGLWSLAFSLDGKYIAAGGVGGFIYIFDVDRKKRVRTIAAHSGTIFLLRCSPDGQYLLSSGTDSNVKLWRWAKLRKTRKNPKPVVSISFGRRYFPSASFSQDGSTLAIGHMKDELHRVSLYNLSKERAFRFCLASNPIETFAVSGNGKEIVTAGDKGEAWAWNFATNSAKKIPLETDKNLIAVDSSNNGKYSIFAEHEGQVFIWDIQKQALFSTWKAHEKELDTVKISPDSQSIVTGSGNGEIKVWSFPEGVLLAEKTDLSSGVLSADYSSNSQMIAATGEKRSLFIWDWKNDKIVVLTEDTGPEDWRWFKHVRFSPDDKQLISGGYDKRIHVWSTESGKLIREIYAHDHYLNYVGYSTDGLSIISASDDSTIRFFDTATLSEFQRIRLNMPVNKAVFLADGKHFVYQDWSDIVVAPFLPALWKKSSKLLLREAQCKVGMILDEHSIQPMPPETIRDRLPCPPITTSKLNLSSCNRKTMISAARSNVCVEAPLLP